MSREKKDEEAIYYEAAKRPPAERMAYLKTVCGEDDALFARLETLLRAREIDDDFLKVPPLESAATLDGTSLTEGPGTVIGRYKLLEKIGEGGMAVVYMAEQEEPIRRKVALKIIKLGMDTKSVIARFEAERQALAMMDHPNIAKVLDAGATETGRPYFVMELVKGTSITEFCDANNLSTQERLELFVCVCQAVQHAHQKGIIHRDIKPTNVMVTQHDGTPIPKVIDFGIAKAIHQKLTEKTLFTRYAHIIGTPTYMSPEQAELSDVDIDTRSDIYSLGVLLYELLTGTTPFSEEELRNAGYIEMQRVIREQEPVRPSTKLSTLGQTLTDVARRRSVTPEVLTKAVRGDLDWIVMKSLDKDRSRRYETANGLAEDIRRHLEHEPVLARGPGAMYRMGKLLRRHRSQTIAALALLVVAGGAAIILSMWRRDRLQLDEAESFRHRGILSQAREQYAKADRDTALETIQPILHSRHVGPEAQLLHAGILADNRRSDEAVGILTDLLDEPPEIAGAAHSLLARILWESESPNAEKLKEIEEHRRKAEKLLPETAEAYFLRAMTAITVKEQLASLDRALQLDPAHYESRRLRAFTYYASRKYDKMKDDALVMAVSRPRDPLGYSLRAVALRELGKYMEAIAEYDNAIALTAKGNLEYVDLSIQRCETLLRMGEYERLIADAQECLKLSPDKPASVAGGVEGIPPSNRGQDARDTMDALDTQDFSPLQYHIFCALMALGDYEKADTVFREIIRRTPTSRNEFRDWCAKYIFDTLEAGRTWHPQDRKADGAAFLPMVEAEETYRSLASKGRRLTTDGFSARWSPDGTKLAFSAGVHGYSGVAVYDMATKETELLIVPGKDPRWSPDGKYIAFVRDCQLLRLEEMAKAENIRQQRPVADEEVWVMKSDGTDPRPLAKGSWPSWGSDSKHIYYQSRVENVLYSLCILDQNAEPKQIIKCSTSLTSVSPDNKKVSSLDGRKLTIKDLASRKIVADCPGPYMSFGVTGWSTTRSEVCLGGSNASREKTGLWIYDFDKNELLSVLEGQVGSACWSPDGKVLAFCVGWPYLEIWAADLNPNVSTIEALGPGQTIDEHIRETLACYNRRIETDAEDAYAYSGRAHCYDCLNEKAKARADMRQWSAILSGSDLQSDSPHAVRRIINGPFDYQIVFSAERPVNNTPLLNVAFGQKGRCKMKTFQIPLLSTRGLAMSVLGLCLLSGLGTPSSYADFTFGTPACTRTGWIAPCISTDDLEIYFHLGNDYAARMWMASRATPDAEWGPPCDLGSTVNGPNFNGTPWISPNKLELYFTSNRVGGNYDVWVTTRATLEDDWGTPVNLGAPVNSAGEEGCQSLSADGLELYLISDRPGGFGGWDLWRASRATLADDWGTPVNLGPTINTSAMENFPSISADGLLLFFASTRPGGHGGLDLYMAKRATTEDPWAPPLNLGPIVNSGSHENAARISGDGSMFYFISNRPGGVASFDFWQASVEAICDFNSDGVLDIADVGIMIEHWHTDDPLCDIGPMPWGDGFVDAQDLMVLAEHLFEEETPPAQ